MAEKGLSVNVVVLTTMAVAIGLIMVGSVLAPISQDVMDELTSTIGTGDDAVPLYEKGETWANLIGVVVVISILGLIIVAVNSYTRK